ncbi:hypothetical protein H0H93_014122 [Arthromyces matolae]|nr:hypothetical protein H0H93_014122 [Arthromyces matolae]
MIVAHSDTEKLAPGKLSAPKDTDDDNSEAPSAATNHHDSGTDSGSFPSPSSNSFTGDQTFYANTVDSLAKPINLPLSARDAADSTFNPNIFSSSSTRPNLLSVAIPLGFMICLTVIALSLAVVHFRKRVKRQAIDTEKLANMSRWSSSDSLYKDKGQLEYPANAAIPAHISGPVPLFMPVDLDAAPEPEGKRSPRKSVPMSPSYTNISSPSHSPKSARVSRPLTVSRENRERRNVEEEKVDDESMEL